jgi:hypothetical protein
LNLRGEKLIAEFLCCVQEEEQSGKPLDVGAAVHGMMLQLAKDNLAASVRDLAAAAAQLAAAAAQGAASQVAAATDAAAEDLGTSA